jgi:flagellar biosynthesis component FlhA
VVPEVQILSPRLSPKNLSWLQHQARFLFFVAGAILAVWSLFAPLPGFFVDVFVCIALAAGVASLSSNISSLPGLLVGLAVFRVGLGLSLLRASFSGAGSGLAVGIGATMPGASGLFFVVISSMILGLFLGRAASRAAEVSARFALDSLPGAQASIEAEAKNSADPLQQIKAKETLFNETRWKGAADGAAKLLTGDALLAPLFGVVAALLPLTQSRDISIPTGTGVALLLLAAAIPPAAALAFGVVSLEPSRASFGPLLGAASMLPLLLVPQAPILAPLLVAVICLVLFWAQPRKSESQALELLLPKSEEPRWRAFQEGAEQRLGFCLPPMKVSFSTRADCELRLHEELLSRQSSLEEVFAEAAFRLFSLEEAQGVIQKIREQFPASASLIQAPLLVLHQAMRQSILEGLPLHKKALAEAFSVLPANASKEQCIDEVRRVMRPYLMQVIGEPPIAVLRLEGILEDELRQKRPLDEESIAQLRQRQSEHEQSNAGRQMVLLCHKDARLEICTLLRKKGWHFLVSDELPSQLEIDFLGELGV